ncbi:MAG: SDR family NAD(P)-dependent oxidoreductase [Pseudonocardiaceae bacterium]
MNPRIALVTGATGELGAAIAQRLVALRHQVVLAARNDAAARTLADELGAGTRWVNMDVTDAASVAAAAKTVDHVDIVINNAGVLLDDGDCAATVNLELVERTLAVNTVGAWRVAQAFLPGMLDRGWGRVVNVSSGTASFTRGLFPGAPAYSLSKVGLNAVTVLLAQATSGRGVLVNAINPGRVRTRMQPDAPRAPDEAAVDVVAVATLPDGPTGQFLRAGSEVMPW